MKLYRKMKWRQYKKRVWDAEQVRALGAIRPGDIRQDCDYFNHRVQEVCVRRVQTRSGRGWFVRAILVCREDGLPFCSCPAGAGPSWPAESVDRAIREFARGVKDPATVLGAALFQAICDGRPVCDAVGLPLFPSV